MSDIVPQDSYLKYCPGCDSIYPATTKYFHRNKSRSDGLHEYCKTCRHDQIVEKTKTDPDFHAKRYQKYRPQTPEEQEQYRARQAANMRISRARRKQPGLCTSCFIRPVEPGHLCDVCAAYQKQYRESNPDKIKVNHKRVRDRLRDQILTSYGGKCTCCGETRPEFLSVDHVNGGGRTHTRAINGHLYTWLRKNKFPKEGFQLLCHNCNYAKYAYGVCPHQQNTP